MKSRNKKQLGLHLFVFILSLAIPFTLYFIRHLDDNRLTSWNWIFDYISLSRLGILLAGSLVFALLLSRFTFYEKRKPLVLFVASYGMAFCFWSEPEVIVDSARYFTQAKQLSIYGLDFFAAQWGKKIFAWTDLPLMPFLYGLIFKVFGEQRIFIQAFTTLLFSATVVLTYGLGKTLWDEETGFYGGLLLLGFPYLYSQIPLLLVDVPTMFFFMLGVVATITALKRGGTLWIILAGLGLFLVFYIKYSTWLLLTLIPIIYIYFICLNPRRTMKRGFGVALLALVLIGIFFLLYKDVLIPQLEFLVKYQKPGLNRWGESYISTFLFQIHPFISAAALFAFWVAVRKVDFRFTVVSFLVLLFLLLQVKRIRYTIPLFPMIALMASYGLGEIRNRKLLKHLVFSIVGTSFAIAFMGFLPFLKTLGVGNLQAAGNYLNSVPGTTAEVVSLAGDDAVINPATAVPVLDIYTNKRLVCDCVPISPEVLEKTKASPLRFTWEYTLPEYYLPQPNTENTDALVIVSAAQARILPPEVKKKTESYPLWEKFQQSAHIFQHQTFVTVYHK